MTEEAAVTTPETPPTDETLETPAQEETTESAGTEEPQADQETQGEGQETTEEPQEGAEGQETTEGGEETPEGKEKAEAAKKGLDDQQTEIEFKGEKYQITVGKMKELVLKAEEKVQEANTAIEKTETQAKETKAFVEELRQDFTMGAYRVLLDKHGGDEGKAWEELVGKCRTIVQRDEEWRGMSDEQREAVVAKRDAARYKTEAETLRKQATDSEENGKAAEQIEKFLGVARPALKEVGLPASESVLRRMREIYEFNVKAGRHPTVAGCAKLLKEELEKARKGLQTDAIAAMDPLEFIRTNPEAAKRLVDTALKLAKGKIRSGTASGTPENGASAAPGKAGSLPAKKGGSVTIPTGLSSSAFFRELDRMVP